MRNIKLSVLEFDYHAEVLRNTCRIVENSSIRLSVFTTTKIWEQTNLYQTAVPENIQLYILNREELSITAFVKKNLSILNTSDIILFNTVASNYRLFYRLNLIPPVIVRIHNSNAYFKPLFKNYKPKFTPFFLWKDFSHFTRNTIFKLDWYYRKKLLKKIDYYAFPSQIIKQFATDNLNVPIKKAIILPFSYAANTTSSRFPKNKNNEITISVIGRVDKRSRDYLLLYRSFCKISSMLKQNDFKIRLILLGSANSLYGKRLIELFSSIQSPKLSIISFSNFVKQDEFTDYLSQTDFLILPLKSSTRYIIYDEKYGYTKISGNINDIITYKKPALITTKYPVEDNLKLITETFSDEKELAAKVIEWCDTKIYNSFVVDDALKPYQLAVIKAQFNKEIRNITFHKSLNLG